MTVDESKIVKTLGEKPIAMEVVKSARSAIARYVAKEGVTQFIESLIKLILAIK